MCTSDLFLSNEWVASLFNPNTIRMTPLDFRLTAVYHFRMLGIFCARAMPLLDDIVAGFSEQQLITTKVVSSTSFAWQVNALSDKLETMMKGTILTTRTSQFVSALIAHSGMHSVLHTNAFRFSRPGSNTYDTVITAYPLNKNTSNWPQGYAICNPVDHTTYQAAIYPWATVARPYLQMMNPQPPAAFQVTGMRVGCMPDIAILESNLECFFDATCVNMTASWISSLPPSAWPEPLKLVPGSRYKATSPLTEVFEERFIDILETTSNFSAYYATCAPVQCSYTYVEYRSALYVVTLLIGWYGGLIVALRTTAPLLVSFAYKVKEQCRMVNRIGRGGKRGTDSAGEMFAGAEFSC